MRRAVTLDPIALLQLALKVDRRAASIIIIGLVAFTVVAIINTLGMDDPKGSALAVAYVVGAGFLISILAKIVGDSIAQTVLSWAVTALIVVFMATVAYGAIVPRQTLVNPPACVLQFWAPCNDKLDELASVQAPVSPLPPPSPASQPRAANPSTAPAPSSIVPPPVNIYVQFAGLISRENMIKVSTGLVAQGWKVQGANRGGERTQAAAGLNEVRYANPELKGAAERLAQELSATGIANRPVRARQVDIPRFPANTMEAWNSN